MNRALTIGINYPGTDCELRGCLSDADDWADFAAHRGFQVEQLKDAQATRRNILEGVARVVDQTQPAETGLIAYSGHGTWMPDEDGDEPDRRDEALCPVDMGDDGANLIVDDELHLLFNTIRPGARILFLADCCHSGTVFRFNPRPQGGARRVRFLPPSHFLKRPDLVLNMTRAYGRPMTGGNAPLHGLLHMAGCRDNEYSADADFDGRPNGAFTYFALRAFEWATRVGATYRQAFDYLRQYLPSWEYQQTPQFHAPKALQGLRVFN